MKKLLGFLCLSFFALHSFAQSNRDGNIAIIPEPVSLTQKEGEFTLPKRVVIETSTGPEMKEVIATLRERFSVPTGSKVVVLGNAQTATIKLILNKKADDVLGKEGYSLAVTPKGIFIKANEPAGLFYGVQTLLQLFPKEIAGAKYAADVKWVSPCVEITDYPRFKWRGLMFDVSRHFFTKAEVEQYIDNMVKYKLNLLHMHLTDDEGWRVEIKSLPRLTTV
ncbi:MAG TPA: glycoside hydrolase family 20 zincin-like fold domain-containing protein, partial [Mucilaginibacter sp.]|nr:glycoside hydrolase family 20 zincin-like fold domain-containing protein [Mucilaginibacter sp.]